MKLKNYFILVTLVIFSPSKAEKWSFESLRSLYIPKKLKKDKKFKLIFIDRDQLKLLDKKNLKKDILLGEFY